MSERSAAIKAGQAARKGEGKRTDQQEATREPFNTPNACLAYLIAEGWINPDHKADLACALAVFANTQRIIGSINARIAMDKAARKAW